MTEDQQDAMNKGRVASLRIEYTDANGLDRLRPLWLCLHRHHQMIAPNLGPYVDDDTSWTMRRRFYADCLSHKGSFALSAYSKEDLVGYALVRVEATSTMWSDTWVTGDRTAEIETLVVAPDQRGQGIGAVLLDRNRVGTGPPGCQRCDRRGAARQYGGAGFVSPPRIRTNLVDHDTLRTSTKSVR